MPLSTSAQRMKTYPCNSSNAMIRAAHCDAAPRTATCSTTTEPDQGIDADHHPRKQSGAGIAEAGEGTRRSRSTQLSARMRPLRRARSAGGSAAGNGQHLPWLRGSISRFLEEPSCHVAVGSTIPTAAPTASSSAASGHRTPCAPSSSPPKPRPHRNYAATKHPHTPATAGKVITKLVLDEHNRGPHALV